MFDPSLEPSCLEQHMFSLRNKKYIIFELSSILSLIWIPDHCYLWAYYIYFAVRWNFLFLVFEGFRQVHLMSYCLLTAHAFFVFRIRW